MSEHVAIMTTVGAAADAEKIASTLVRERLAACVQLSAIQSFYVWQDKECREPETLLLIKTRSSLQGAVADRLAALHPYDLPEIAAVPIVFGSAAYLNWIDAQTKDAP